MLHRLSQYTSSNKKLLLLLATSLSLLVAGYMYFQNFRDGNNIETKPVSICNGLSSNESYANAREFIYSGNVTSLSELAETLKSDKGFETDANCLFIAFYAKYMTGDITNARIYADLLKISMEQGSAITSELKNFLPNYSVIDKLMSVSETNQKEALNSARYSN